MSQIETTLRDAVATPFRGVVDRMTPRQFVGLLLGDAQYSYKVSDLPLRNINTWLDVANVLGGVLAGMRDQLLTLERSRVVQIWNNKKRITYGMLDATHAFLPFSAIAGLTAFPQSENDYDFWFNGEPLTNGQSVFISGHGLQFLTAWTADDTGDLWPRNTGLGVGPKPYVFLGSNLVTVDGHDTLPFASRPKDIYNRTVDPLPLNGAQVEIWIGPKLTMGTDPDLDPKSWTFSTDANDYPVLTFHGLDIPDDKAIHVWILAEQS